MTTPLISSLLFPIRPTTIFWRIWTIVINTIEAQFWRWFPHIGEEGFEIVSPSFTNRNSASTVISKSVIFRVFAPIDHATPAPIDLCQRATGSVPVFVTAGFENFEANASATCGIACSELREADNAFYAAVANAEPVCISLFRVRKPHGGQTAKPLIRDISDRCHIDQYSTSHPTWKLPNPWVLEAAA